LEEAALFTDARYNFAITETAPGHATMVSGAYPEKHGIVSNVWFDYKNGTRQYCVEDSYYGRSPRSLKVSTLPDWIKGEFKDSRVISVSGKDRAAILLGGRKADATLWFSRSKGVFTTSSYYDLLPFDWLLGNQSAISADRYFGSVWEPASATEAAFGVAGISVLDRGALQAQFPFPLGGMAIQPDEEFFKAVYKSPFVDEMTYELAKEMLVKEQLGSREDAIDYLAISFSALDTVGHSFGPDSKEAADVLFRLDTLLAQLFELIEEQVGLDKTLVVLTSDHGVQPYPELSNQSRGRSSRRAHGVDIACVQAAGKTIEEKLGVDELWLAPLVLNQETLRVKRIARTKVDAVVRETLEDCPAIQKVWTRDDLLFGGDGTPGPFRGLYRRSVSGGRGADYYIQHPEGFLKHYPNGTGHGSPYRYDRQVPVFVMAPKVKKGRLHEPVHMVDLAPTIASLIGVDIPRFVEGRDKSKLLFKK
jgi:predicted AlkP superfamily pyrophosphatase or phosphodiesterase